MSTNLKPFTQNISFAGQPTPEELELWSKTGIRSVVNMRPAGEVERGLSPEHEEKICSDLQMGYFHLPTGLDGLDENYVLAAKKALDGAEIPLAIHCAGGARAAILAAALYSAAEGASADEVVAMVEATGQSFNPDLKQKVVKLVESTS